MTPRARFRYVFLFFRQPAFDSFRTAERWNEAAEFGRKLAELKPGDSMRWLRVAPVMVRAGDEDYVAFCKWIVEQPADTPELAERAIKACLLQAGVVDIADLPTAALTKPLDEGNAPKGIPPWGWATRALLAYRSGDVESAVKFVTRSEELTPPDFAHAMNLAVLALAQHQLQHPDEARKALEEASQLVIHLKDDSKNKGHHDLLIAQILLREAEAKITGKAEPTPPDAAHDQAAPAEKTPPAKDPVQTGSHSP